MLIGLRTSAWGTGHKFRIDNDKCNGCTLCSKNCPVGAITGTIKQGYTFVIDQDKCIGSARCGVCFSKCKKGAVVPVT